MKKTNVFKQCKLIFSSICLFLFIGLATSCQKEDLETNPTEATTEEKIKPVVEPIRYNYKYDYNGQIYNEKQWENKYAELGSPNVSVVVFNDMMYIFDDYNEAQLFENGELQSLMDKEPATYDSLSKAQILGQKTVKYKLELFDAKDYLRDSQNIAFIITGSLFVTKRRTWWSWDYFENNEVEFDLPSWISEKTTSYRATFIQGGRIDTSGASTSTGYIQMNLELKLGTLEDDSSTSWTKRLRKNPYFPGGDVSQDSDFSDNRIWGVFGLYNWNNKIESVKIVFEE